MSRLVFIALVSLLLACKSDPPPSHEPAPPDGPDPLIACRRTVNEKSVKWQCPGDVVALDMQAKEHHQQDEVTLNLEKFSEAFTEMGAKRDDAEFVAGSAHYRSVKVAGEKSGAGPFVSRMVVVDGDPTRYVSCATKREACDDVIRALLAREAGAP
jgi:hypothetical protein